MHLMIIPELILYGSSQYLVTWKSAQGVHCIPFVCVFLMGRVFLYEGKSFSYSGLISSLCFHLNTCIKSQQLCCQSQASSTLNVTLLQRVILVVSRGCLNKPHNSSGSFREKPCSPNINQITFQELNLQKKKRIRKKEYRDCSHGFNHHIVMIVWKGVFKKVEKMLCKPSS